MKRNLILINFLFCLIIISKAQQLLNQTQDVTEFIQKYYNQQPSKQQSQINLNFSIATGFIPVLQNQPGYINTTSSLFFELMTKQGETLATINPQTPLILLFAGGPGCSTQRSSWAQYGFFYVDNDNIMQVRNYSWNLRAHLLFIDSPLGVGYSYTNANVTVNNTQMAWNAVSDFLTNFYSLSNFSMLKQNPTFIQSQSYGGHYGPYYSYMMMTNNIWNITYKGLLVGNPWTNAYLQQQYFQNLFYSAGLASIAQAKTMQQISVNMENNIKKGNFTAAALNLVNQFYFQSRNVGPVDEYNFQNYGDSTTYPLFENLLNSTSFALGYGIPQSIIDWVQGLTQHGEQQGYQICNYTVEVSFSQDLLTDYRQYLEYVLNNGLKVVFYTGNLDIVTCNGGVTALMNSLVWNGATNWQNTAKTVWVNDGVVIGSQKIFQNLKYSIIYNAGHLVGQDIPLVGLLILDDFLQFVQ